MFVGCGWMYRRTDADGKITDEFVCGLQKFLLEAANNDSENGAWKMWCPCEKCKNTKFLPQNVIYRHLYNRGFMSSDYIRTNNAEDMDHKVGDSSNPKVPLYFGCPASLTKLDLSYRLLEIKNRHHLSETCMDEIAQLVTDVLPKPNQAATTYSELKQDCVKHFAKDFDSFVSNVVIADMDDDE